MPRNKLNDVRNAPENRESEFRQGAMQKSDSAERQIRQAMLGMTDSIVCPYCSSNVMLGAEKLCCEPMGEVVANLLHRTEIEQLRKMNVV